MDFKRNRRSLILLISIGLVLSLAIWFLLARTSLIKSRSESLLIQADAPCKVNIDGDEMVMAHPGMVSVKVPAGQHLVSAMSLEENIVWEDLVYVPEGKEVLVNIRLAAKVAAAKKSKLPVEVE